MERIVKLSILAVYVAVSCGFAFRLRSQVNMRLPRGQSAEFVPLWNYLRMLELHREFYPDSRVRLAACLWDAAGAVAVFLLLMFLRI